MQSGMRFMISRDKGGRSWSVKLRTTMGLAPVSCKGADLGEHIRHPPGSRHQCGQCCPELRRETCIGDVFHHVSFPEGQKQKGRGFEAAALEKMDK
jgi:hypothetical protein